ncbi:MAG: hemolysin family protein [Bacteroidetes bacterium]|nr:hemolysin family protein [Bacteroidota bacterium]MCL6101130.1 hemolysin family protein [Bacteroidota bacterium]
MGLDILITILLVSFNGFFVAAEFAIVKVRASQLELRVKDGNRFAILSKHIVSHLDGYLAATQLGITLASLGLGWIGEPVVSKIIIKIMDLMGLSINPELAHTIALPVAFGIITVLHIVFGELAPKSLAIQHSEKITLFIAYPLQFFFILFKPVIWILNSIANFILRIIGISAVQGVDVHSSEELKYLVQQGQESGKIDADEYKIIKNAFDFSEQTAKQIMVPRTQVFALDVNDFDESMLDKVIDESYSRIPCYEDSLDNTVGVVYLKDILLATRKNEPLNIRSIMRTIHIVPDTKHIGQLLNEFQIIHQQMALVVNEYGGTEGIITMEDILEELVGEIQDEFDNEVPFVEQIADKTYNALASATLDDINELLPHPLGKDDQYETLAGYLIMKFGKIPYVKEKITVDNYEFSILKKNKRSLVLVQLIDLLA